jgi:uncharacterized protein (TIGR03790 family)
LASPTTGRPDLLPEHVLIIANRAVPESMELARYYMKSRQIPLQNLVQVQTSKEEHISREVFEREIAAPVRDFVTRTDPAGKRLGCILLMYGIPLRIEAPMPSAEEAARRLELNKRLIGVQEKSKELDKTDPQTTKRLKEEQADLEKQIMQVNMSTQGASVDSELALVMEIKPRLEGWLPNRYFFGFRGKDIENMPKKVLAVSRLDGPSKAVVQRIIDNSIQAEREGLVGKAYFDARWPDKSDKEPSAYQQYDRAIHNTARIVEKSKKLPVVLDEREGLFQQGEAPNAALYCGWYSLGKYVDAFTWAKGAIGFHIASSECTTLKAENSTVWCKVMLEKGVAATIGPVAEPYLESFPQPEVFFGCLLDGHQLAECYAVSNPFWSWQQVLIGDPLYRPFKMRSNGQK